MTTAAQRLTSDFKSAAFNSGYMVSLQDYEFQTSIELLSSELLEEYRMIAMENNAYIGFWLDNNDLYVDLSINIDNLNEAIKIAQENKQLAIYNCRKEKAYMYKYTVKGIRTSIAARLYRNTCQRLFIEPMI